jgi:hypothetical protein
MNGTGCIACTGNLKSLRPEATTCILQSHGHLLQVCRCATPSNRAIDTSRLILMGNRIGTSSRKVSA